ncbi:MAG: hypothetical protein I8H77_05065 [Comamonadaceae bacterium]|nr:hypothetical protein [Comamonadaceae bacterium]
MSSDSAKSLRTPGARTGSGAPIFINPVGEIVALNHDSDRQVLAASFEELAQDFFLSGLFALAKMACREMLAKTSIELAAEQKKNGNLENTTPWPVLI